MNRIGSFAYDWMDLAGAINSLWARFCTFARSNSLSTFALRSKTTVRRASDALSIMRLESISSNTQTCAVVACCGRLAFAFTISITPFKREVTFCTWSDGRADVYSVLCALCCVYIAKHTIHIATGLCYHSGRITKQYCSAQRHIILWNNKSDYNRQRYDMGSCSCLFIQTGNFMSFCCANMIFVFAVFFPVSFCSFFFRSILTVLMCFCISRRNIPTGGYCYAVRNRKAALIVRAANVRRLHCIRVNRMSASEVIYIYPKIYKSTTTTATTSKMERQ